jgi:hypothetical protein
MYESAYFFTWLAELLIAAREQIIPIYQSSQLNYTIRKDKKVKNLWHSTHSSF